MLEILVSSETVCVIEGDTAVFYCIARADEIYFFVNGTIADEQSVDEEGFKESKLVDINETIKEKTLTTTALTQYNNTSITCRASITENKFPVDNVLSSPAILLVRGTLMVI